jgi:hypothetical protein
MEQTQLTNTRNAKNEALRPVSKSTSGRFGIPGGLNHLSDLWPEHRSDFPFNSGKMEL